MSARAWFLASAVGLAAVSSSAMAQNQYWLSQFGSGDDELSSGLASDGVGGIYVAGETLGSVFVPTFGMYDG